MPKLPEVEIIRQGLLTLTGNRFTDIKVQRSDLRMPVSHHFAARLKGRLITRLTRRGKYLLIHCEDSTVIIAHLGMSGQLLILPDDVTRSKPHDHIIFTTDKGFRLIFHDPRRFGLMLVTTEDQLNDHRCLNTLGPEPLNQKFTPTYLWTSFAGRRRNIKSTLLDQTLVAGLGNIYVCEVLFYAGIDPQQCVNTLSYHHAERLVDAIRHVLTEAILAGGTSIKDYVHSSGQSGYFQNHLAVYGRTHHPCPGCDCDVTFTGGILRIVQSNRATYYCPQRQRQH